jgi:hypothetical protein
MGHGAGRPRTKGFAHACAGINALVLRVAVPNSRILA